MPEPFYQILCNVTITRTSTGETRVSYQTQDEQRTIFAVDVCDGLRRVACFLTPLRQPADHLDPT